MPVLIAAFLAFAALALLFQRRGEFARRRTAEIIPFPQARRRPRHF